MSCYIEHSGDFFSVRNLKKTSISSSCPVAFRNMWMSVMVNLDCPLDCDLWGCQSVTSQTISPLREQKSDQTIEGWWKYGRKGLLLGSESPGPCLCELEQAQAHSWSCPSSLSACWDLASPPESTEMSRRSQHYLLSFLVIHVGRMSQWCQLRPTQCTYKLSDHPHTSMSTSFS